MKPCWCLSKYGCLLTLIKAPHVCHSSAALEHLMAMKVKIMVDGLKTSAQMSCGCCLIIVNRAAKADPGARSHHEYRRFGLSILSWEWHFLTFLRPFSHFSFLWILILRLGMFRRMLVNWLHLLLIFIIIFNMNIIHSSNGFPPINHLHLGDLWLFKHGVTCPIHIILSWWMSSLAHAWLRTFLVLEVHLESINGSL